MTFDKKCPGSRIIREPVPELVNCPNCGKEVEIWTDELRTTCSNCGTKVFREQQPSCIEWCSYAKECVGPEVFERLKLQPKETPAETGPATPLGTLLRDHEKVLEKLNVLQAASLCLRVSAQASPSPIRDNGINNLTKVIEFFDKELKTHFQQEEEIFFPAIEKHVGGEKSPVQLLLKEHSQFWQLYDQLKSKLDEFQKGGCEQPVATEIYEIAVQIMGLLRGHIEKENTSLLPMAKSMLGEGELKEISEKLDPLSPTLMVGG